MQGSLEPRRAEFGTRPVQQNRFNMLQHAAVSHTLDMGFTMFHRYTCKMQPLGQWAYVICPCNIGLRAIAAYRVECTVYAHILIIT